MVDAAWGALLSCLSSAKSSVVRQGSRVTRAVQHPDDNDRILQRLVIDRIAIMERDAQVGRELFSLETCERKMPYRLERRFEADDETGCDRLGRLGCEVGPDLREVLFGRLGEAKS